MAKLFRSPLVRHMAGLAAIALMIVIAALSLVSPADLPSIEGSDKLKHFTAYTVLGTAMAVWAGPGRALRALVLTAGYGALMEVAQALASTGRDPSLLDEGANILGAGLGTGIALLLRR